MRLLETEKKAILDVVLSLDPNAKIYIFGSRADDKKKGGDIGILVLSTNITERDRRGIKLKLYDLLGEQKIDLLIAASIEEPFVKIALETGVAL